MSNIEKENFMDVPHDMVKWQDEGKVYHYPLRKFKNSSLKLYIALRHFANRFSTRKFYMDDDTLAQVVGLSLKQLGRAKNTLRKMGLIVTVKRRNRVTDYEILDMPKMTTDFDTNGKEEGQKRHITGTKVAYQLKGIKKK